MKTQRKQILEHYETGSKLLPSLTIETIGYKYVTCVSIMNGVHYIKYTLSEFLDNFINDYK